MKKLFFLIFMTVSTSLLFSQNNRDTVWTSYISLKSYELKHKKPLTKKDSLNFKFVGNDTLVLIETSSVPKGVMVKYEPKDSVFLDYYKKIAFKHTNNVVSKKTTMKYWKTPIKIYFTNSVSNNVKKEIMSFANDISNQIDSLHIMKVNKLKDANYIIYYDGDYEFDDNLKNTKSASYFSHWKHNKIFKTFIKVNPNFLFNDKMIIENIKNQFVLSLGHFNIIEDFDCVSYFSNCYSPNKKITNLDIEFLKYHYSYGICKGTSLETFEEQHKNAQEAFKKTGKHMLFLHEE